MNLVRSLALFAVLLILGGCSGGATGAGGGSGGGTSGSGGGTGGTGGTDGGWDGGASGLIWLTQRSNRLAMSSYSASAAFAPEGFSLPKRGGCPITNIGSCEIVECSLDAGSQFIDAGNPVSAGQISLAIAGTDAGVVLQVNANFYNSAGMGTLWNGGEQLTLTATGSDAGVRAFVATVVAPQRAVLTAPVEGASRVFVVRDMPFTLAWAPVPGTALITVGSSAAGRSVGAFCTVAASTGSFTIPATVTRRLIPFDLDSPVLSISITQESDLLVGPYLIRTMATYSYSVNDSSIR